MQLCLGGAADLSSSNGRCNSVIDAFRLMASANFCRAVGLVKII